ncbi:glycerophosphoryl diester phosphodiesterase [Lachnospiraceae bacterium NE2001]|nr:glycerophosphoryl diester phosphodiesterase [Lachnospiraceae bacterium NE2001]
MIKIVAHRGASGQPGVENTLESFQKAIELGVDMVEFDVRKTKDNVLVVYHDKNFADQPVSWYTYEEMEKQAQIRGFHVPLFVEVLELCSGKVFMDIEIKETGFEHRVVRFLHKYSDYKDYSVKSFKDAVPFKIKELDPKITTGLLLGYEKADARRRINELFPIRRLRACHADFVSPHFLLLRFGFEKRMKKAGYPIYVWTVNAPEVIDEVLQKQVTGIITDNPVYALEARAKMSTPDWTDDISY